MIPVAAGKEDGEDLDEACPVIVEPLDGLAGKSPVVPVKNESSDSPIAAITKYCARIAKFGVPVRQTQHNDVGDRSDQDRRDPGIVTGGPLRRNRQHRR